MNVLRNYDVRRPAGPDNTPLGAAPGALDQWEDVLRLLVDPDSPAVPERDEKRRLLSFLLERADIDEDRFWGLTRGQRGRLFLSRYSRASRDIPQLEITSFDVDKLHKERFRNEPLTLGAAWHFGFWRSYFSHAAITHPANDGLREEFSTAWLIGRRQPAVLFRKADGVDLEPIRTVKTDMPMLVGPLPYTDGHTLERAYLRAIETADPDENLKTRSLVVVPADQLIAHEERYLPHAPWILPRLEQRHIDLLATPAGAPLARLLDRVRLIELDGIADLARRVRDLHARYGEAQFSVHLAHGPDFYEQLERAVRCDHIAMVQVHSGDLKSYELISKVDEHLKRRFLRARIQLVSAGGNTDTHASAATVYEAVLLGANGGAMTHVASLALVPDLVDVYHGAPAAPVIGSLADRDEEELEAQARNTLTCWQHSILDFLSCMGIDDIQKTSGNAMAITITKDWIREVDSLATPEFGIENRALNAVRVAAEPVPQAVRERYRVSRILEELDIDLPEVQSARMLADESASWHLMNTNRNLTADFLEVIYKMAAGAMPQVDEFFLAGDMGLGSMDEVDVKVSRESLAWSLERLGRDPSLLDYISLAIPRGFDRPGALRSKDRGRLVRIRDGAETELACFDVDARGGFEVELGSAFEVSDSDRVVLRGDDRGDGATEVELLADDHGGHGLSVVRASVKGDVCLKRSVRGEYSLVGRGLREPIWHGPVSHASISLGAASEDFLGARIEGNEGLAFTSSGEGGPINVDEEAMAWQSMQAASGHFGIEPGKLRRMRDVEIKINQGAKPGKGGRLSGAKVTETVSRARNIPVGTNALSPDPKHDIYSIEDMPAEVWLWLMFENHCGIKITGSNYTRYVAAGMWSNFVVDYLLIDSGLGGSGNYHADSSHVGWPDIFRTILHTHHALVSERVDLDDTGELRTIRDNNGTPMGAAGGTRLFASGGLRGELDMLKVLIAGADGVVEASIGKAVAFGCNQCGNCHLDCPRGGITTKPELTQQNQRDVMRRRFRNWTITNMVKLAVLIDAINYEHGALDAAGEVVDADALIDDIRKLRGRTDLLEMPRHPEQGEPYRTENEHDSCRVGSLAVSVPVTVDAIWEAARLSFNGGNNRGGGIDFAGFAPPAVREKTCVIFNTIGPDRAETMAQMLGHFAGCRAFDAAGIEMAMSQVLARLPEFKLPVRPECQGEDGWRKAGLREAVGDYYMFFVELRDEVLEGYGRKLLASEHWLQRRTKYSDLDEAELAAALRPEWTPPADADARTRLEAFVTDVREEYFSALGHLLDTRYYRTFTEGEAPAGKYSAKRRGFMVSMGEDLGAVKLSGWTHAIPDYFDFEEFWRDYPGVKETGGAVRDVRGHAQRSKALRAHVWGMHHRYPTNSPAIDAEGRGNPAGAHPFKAYNLLLMHNGEQVAVDSTAPFLCEYGYVHADDSMGPGAADYEGDSVYERKALTDTEYAAYLVDFTRRVLGLSTEEASQIISPITGIDLEAMAPEQREKLRLLMTNYVQLTPTGPYKFTIVESMRRDGERVVGFRENMDIKFLRPHEIISHRDKAANGAEAVANGSEAKIADSMLRMLRRQGVLQDGGCDLRFNMRSGGKPGLEEHGGVFEAFVVPRHLELSLVNRFGETVPVKRAGFRADLSLSLEEVERQADREWMERADELVDDLIADVARSPESTWGPEDPLPAGAARLIGSVLDEALHLTFHDLRYLLEVALPRTATMGDGRRSLCLRVLTELRKRLTFANLGNKALSSVEYLTDGGHDPAGRPEGGIFRILDAVPPLARAWGESRHLRIDAATRDDLVGPSSPTDVLVVDLFEFVSEAFELDCCSRFLHEAVRLGWRHVVGYNARGGPRYIATNLPDVHGASALDVVFELYGRELGDFCGALLEGGRVYTYGQAQSHVGFKADSGYLFVLQDALNTCLYSAHGGTFSAWDSGSRFAVAGQNKVYLDDRVTLAQGLKSIHFGSPNEYAFEYLMSGGENSLHVVLGLKKPDANGELSLRPKPYAGKFLMSGAAAGCVVLFDPLRKLDEAQHRGNVEVEIEEAEWLEKIGPFIADEARRRGAPIRIDGESFSVRLQGNWRTWHYSQAFIKLVPAVAPAPQVAAH